MSNSITTSNFLPSDIENHIFHFCTPEQNVKHTQVCKKWYRMASEVAKRQFYQMREKDIERKAANFLKMVPENLEFYCPSYAELKKMKFKDLSFYSIKQVHDHAIEAWTEKYTVCMRRFYRVHPGCPNIPSEIKENVAGKAFVELELNRSLSIFSIKFALWTETLGDLRRGDVKYLPIEFFNLTLGGQVEEPSVIGEKNEGAVCFVLRGRLMEMVIEEEGLMNRIGHYFEPTQLETARTINLSPEIVTPGDPWPRVWPNDLYVAERDAHPRKPN